MFLLLGGSWGAVGGRLQREGERERWQEGGREEGKIEGGMGRERKEGEGKEGGKVVIEEEGEGERDREKVCKNKTNKQTNTKRQVLTCDSEPIKDLQCVTICISFLRAASRISGQLSGMSRRINRAKILVTWCLQLGKLVMMFWREMKVVRTSSWSMWMARRDKRSMRSSRVMSAGMMRGMAATQVFRRSNLGFTGLWGKEGGGMWEGGGTNREEDKAWRWNNREREGMDQWGGRREGRGERRGCEVEPMGRGEAGGMEAWRLESLARTPSLITFIVA